MRWIVEANQLLALAALPEMPKRTCPCVFRIRQDVRVRTHARKYLDKHHLSPHGSFYISDAQAHMRVHKAHTASAVVQALAARSPPQSAQKAGVAISPCPLGLRRSPFVLSGLRRSESKRSQPAQPASSAQQQASSPAALSHAQIAIQAGREPPGGRPSSRVDRLFETATFPPKTRSGPRSNRSNR